MKIIIIGSKGFIGQHALSYFRTKGNEVWGCDVNVDYTDPNYFLVDTTNSNFHSIFEQQQFDVCINCSGAASVPDSFNNPARDFALNVHNVVNLLDAIRKYRSNCKFINLSSAAVYGNPLALPITEQMVAAPVSPYGFHKLMAENVCDEYHRYFNLQTISFRVFSAYGPGLKKQLFWDIYQKLKLSNSVELWGTGNESRDFIYVSDIIRIVEIYIKKGEFNGKAINIGNGEQITIDEAAKTIISTTQWNGELKFNNQVRQGDPLNWEANICKIKDLGYKQQVDLKEGLKRYIEWANENA
ncbi:MAG: dTDP-glucose 4 6-dehydratase [Bacteroidetes bacterium]|nr:MAG: dTDP-glucose 4 6-dehydratase [Bacteroidota bacterium]